MMDDCDDVCSARIGGQDDILQEELDWLTDELRRIKKNATTLKTQCFVCATNKILNEIFINESCIHHAFSSLGWDPISAMLSIKVDL